MKTIISVLERVENKEITTYDAQTQILNLFGVMARTGKNDHKGYDISEKKVVWFEHVCSESGSVFRADGRCVGNIYCDFQLYVP